MQDPTNPLPSIALPENASTHTTFRVFVQQTLSPEDKMELYAILQDLADEIRRIDRESQKKQQETEEREPLGVHPSRVSQEQRRDHLCETIQRSTAAEQHS